MRRGWKIFWIVCGICAGIGLVCCSISFIMGVTVEAIEDRFPNGIGIVRKAAENDYYDDLDDNDLDDLDDLNDDYDDDDLDDDYSWRHEEESHSTHHVAGSSMGAVTNTGSTTKVVSGTGSQSFTGVSDIDVYIWGGALEVDTMTSATDTITVETENISEKLGLKCYMDGNELKMVTKKKVVGINSKRIGRVIIHVPQSYKLGEASLELVGGYVHVQDIYADTLSVDVGAGEGVVENFTALEADLNCGAGSLTATGNAEKQTEIECGVGEIVFTATGKESDYNYEIDCGIGEIICGGASYAGLGAERTINNHAEKYMEISCGMGSVAVNFAGM